MPLPPSVSRKGASCHQLTESTPFRSRPQVVFQVLTKSRPLVISLLGEPVKGAKRALLGQSKVLLEDLPEEKDMRCDENVIFYLWCAC